MMLRGLLTNSHLFFETMNLTMHSAVNQPMQIASIILSKETKYSIYVLRKGFSAGLFFHGHYEIDIQTFTSNKQKATLFLFWACNTKFQQLTLGSSAEFKLICGKNPITDHFLWIRF